MSQSITGSRPDREPGLFSRKTYIDVECLHCKETVHTVSFIGLLRVEVVRCEKCGTVFNRFTRKVLVKAGTPKTELDRLEEKLRETGGLEKFLANGLDEEDSDG